MAAAQNTLPIAGMTQGFARLPMKNRIGLMIAAAALIAAVAAAFLYGAAPDYRVLFTNVSDRDGGAIVQALGQMNVPYRIAEGGGAILVPAQQVHDVRLKLASQGLPRGGTVGFEQMDTQKFGTTQFQEQVNYQRALEGELARSIQSLAAVRSARVHLAIPKPSVFLRDSQKPTASVLVNLHPGRTLERAQIAGIVHLVASSVPELPVKGVSIVDENGVLLSGPSDTRPGAQLDPTQLAYAQQIEASFTKRIQDILEPIVGRSNVRAQVTAELDFSESEATAESYRPNQNPQEAAVRSMQSHESSQSAPGGPGGVPGALTNQPAPAATAPIGGAPANASKDAQNQQSVSTRKETTTNYEVDKTIRHTRTPTGTVKRLSAAVVINHRRMVEPAAADAPAAKADEKKADAKDKDAKDAKDDKAPSTKQVPLTPEELAQVTALVKEAIGYSQTRGDSLNVVNLAFVGDEIDSPPELPLWKQPENIALAKELGKAGALGLLVLIVLFGFLRPLMKQLATAPAPPEGALEGELVARDGGEGPGGGGAASAAAQLSGYEQNLAAAKQIAKQDPKVVANVVKNWVAGNE
jgi:flagellar M-ring protein FliF